MKEEKVRIKVEITVILSHLSKLFIISSLIALFCLPKFKFIALLLLR